MAYCSARCAWESGHPSQDLQVLAGGFDVVGRASGHTSPWSLIPTSSDIPCDLRNSDPAFDKVACSSALRSGSPESSGDALPLEHLQVADLDLAKAFFEKHAMWSAGSEAHVSSSCIPCFFFFTPRVVANMARAALFATCHTRTRQTLSATELQKQSECIAVRFLDSWQMSSHPRLTTSRRSQCCKLQPPKAHSCRHS